VANILICDDDREIVEAIRIYMIGEGHQCFTAYDGVQALEVLNREEIQLILMDVMMPNMDGLEATKRIRVQYSLPIIFLSAKSEDKDKIEGLNIGADDYITKPFSPEELCARVRSNLRRYTMLGSMKDETSSQYSVGGLLVNDETKNVTVDGELVRLTPIEYNILLLLIKNLGIVYSTNQIYEAIWNESPLGAENTVAVHIRHIREKIEIDPKEPRYIKVVWGVGYKIDRQ